MSCKLLNLSNLAGNTAVSRLFVLDLSGGRVFSTNPDGSDRKIVLVRAERSNLDGSNVETPVQNGGRRHRAPGCDRVPRRRGSPLGRVYCMQKGPDNAALGRICRGNIEITKGETPANRRDIEVRFDRSPEPIDLELESEQVNR